jgi:hypothetical protein
MQTGFSILKTGTAFDIQNPGSMNTADYTGCFGMIPSVINGQWFSGYG